MKQIFFANDIFEEIGGKHNFLTQLFWRQAKLKHVNNSEISPKSSEDRLKDCFLCLKSIFFVELAKPYQNFEKKRNKH